MDEGEWERLSEELRQVISVEHGAFQEPAAAGEPTWLVVRLDGITGIRKTKPKQERMRRIGDVLEAIALLYATSACSQLSRTAKEAFWTRVLASFMMRDRVWKSRHASWAARLARQPVCILLDWSQLGMNVSDISSLLESKLCRRSAQDQLPPMTIGLRLTGCRVTPAGIATLDKLWTQHHQSTLRLATDHIGRLDLSGVSLSRPCIDTLVGFVHHHQVWDLRITLDALARLISTAASIDVLVSRIQRLTLSKSRSPGNPGGPESSWWWLARLMFRIEISSTSDYDDSDPLLELDLADNVISDLDIETFRDSLLAMVQDRVGGEMDELWCRTKPATNLLTGPTPTDVQWAMLMDATVEYRVQETRPGGWIRLDLVEAAHEAWVRIEAIAGFRSRDCTVRLCPRFGSLNLSNVKTSPIYGLSVKHFVALVGSSLRRLSVCSSFNSAVAIPILEQCSYLTHLHLHGDDIMSQLNRFGSETSLRQLRQLSLHPTGLLAVEQLKRFVNEHPTVNGVEITHGIHLDGRYEHQQYALRCEQFVVGYDGSELDWIEPASTPTKLAFLSVPWVGHLPSPLVENVWAFAASRARRRVASYFPRTSRRVFARWLSKYHFNKERADVSSNIPCKKSV